jgi:gliding motility associated protien GldN
MSIRASLALAAATAAAMAITGQVQGQTVLDGAYIKEHTKTQRVVPYPYIREADVMWYRRIWREIDVTDKLNHPLYFPTTPINDRRSLWDVIKNGLLVDGSITAYDGGVDGWRDEFQQQMLPSAVKDKLSRVEMAYQERLDGSGFDSIPQTVEVLSEDIKRYRVKEDWIFDKQRSTMDIRIIGIAPMKEKRGPDGDVRGHEVLFWLYFPELRYVLVNWDVYNRENDAERRSFDHLFWTRQFTSTIIKESNVYDRNIAEFKSGINGVLESEAIKQNLFEFEHDLWNF